MSALDINLASNLGSLHASQWIFILSNVVIFLGYGFIAVKVAPLLPVRTSTLVGAIAFFVFCALTHADQVLHTLGDTNESWGHISMSKHMLLIHIPQAVSVWVFAVGFFTDLDALAKKRGTVKPTSHESE